MCDTLHSHDILCCFIMFYIFDGFLGIFISFYGGAGCTFLFSTFSAGILPLWSVFPRFLTLYSRDNGMQFSSWRSAFLYDDTGMSNPM
jgi:hypothetical protein